MGHIHCVLVHCALSQTEFEHEWTSNHFLSDIRSAILSKLNCAHGIYRKYSDLIPKYKNMPSGLTQNETFLFFIQ